MSVSFRGPTNTIDLANGTAERLLTAMGYKVDASTDGSMTVAEARKGIMEARRSTSRQLFKLQAKMFKADLSAEETNEALHLGFQMDFLWDLQDLVNELHAAGEEKLTWY